MAGLSPAPLRVVWCRTHSGDHRHLDLGGLASPKLHRDCHVKLDYALYSAPFTFIGQILWVRATDVLVSIFQGYRRVATHVRSPRGDRRTVLDNLPPDVREFFAHDRQWCVQRACAELIEQLLSDRIVERLRCAQGILGFASTYGAARVEAACVRALAHTSPAYRTVKSILVGGYDKQPLHSHHIDRQSVYGRNVRFARDARTLGRDAALITRCSNTSLSRLDFP